MLLAGRFLFAPKVVANLHSSPVGLSNGNATVPIIARGVVTLAVLLIGNTRGAVTLDAIGLFVHSLGTDANGNALDLLGRDVQFGEVLEIATGRGVGSVTCGGDGDFLEYRGSLLSIDLAAKCSQLREKNRGGKPRIERRLF
jgi:hypothetical protein